MNTGIPYLQIKDLTKTYPGVVALDRANVDFYPGEVHALLGENGAGKSTLCKMLSGAETPDSGEIRIGGSSFTDFDPITAKKNGVSMVYQEISLIPTMRVYENFFLGKEIRKGRFLDKEKMIAETKEALETFGISLDPHIRVEDLSVAYQQLVEICKIIYEDAKIIILDEPTAPLTNEETSNLFRVVRKLKERGIVIIYITHRLEELYELSEKVTVMRDGKVIETLETQKTDKDQLIRLMVARDLKDSFPEKKKVMGKVALQVENLSTEKLKSVSFCVHEGEVLGLAGLVGSGRTEIARAVFGADKKDTGIIRLGGQEKNIRNPGDAIQNGIALVSEDRKRDGLLMKMSVASNITAVILRRLCRKSFVNKKAERETAERSIAQLAIKTPSQEQIVKNLSGGNQQKVIIAKWLNADSSVIFMDEPTRGIDVGAKQEIYKIIDELRRQGKAIVMISSELPELIGMSDRVAVMYEGSLRGELTGSDITQEKILALASGA